MCLWIPIIFSLRISIIEQKWRSTTQKMQKFRDRNHLNMAKFLLSNSLHSKPASPTFSVRKDRMLLCAASCGQLKSSGNFWTLCYRVYAQDKKKFWFAAKFGQNRHFGRFWQVCKNSSAENCPGWNLDLRAFSKTFWVGLSYEKIKKRRFSVLRRNGASKSANFRVPSLLVQKLTDRSKNFFSLQSHIWVIIIKNKFQGRQTHISGGYCLLYHCTT